MLMLGRVTGCDATPPARRCCRRRRCYWWCWWWLTLLVIGSVPNTAAWDQTLGDVAGKVACNVCTPTIYTWLKLVRWGMPITYATGTVTKLSHLLNSVSPEVVAGFIARWQKPLQFILLHTQLSASEICSSLLSDCGDPPGWSFHWRVPLPPPPPPPHPSVLALASASGSHRKNTTSRVLKVLQFSDIHLEPNYAPSSNTQCANRVYCCRAKDGFLPPSHAHAAGYWGNYDRCDTSPALVHSMLAHIRHQHADVDYMMWTGDNAPHDVHETSRSRILTINGDLTSLVERTLPEVMTLTALGNHDSHPVNSFPSDRVPLAFSNHWLLQRLNRLWDGIVHRSPLDGSSIYSSFSHTFSRHGYYHVEVEDWALRFIVLNTNVCYRWNFWSLLEVDDPGGQLRWLVGQLYEAESAGQRVHILGHLSPGDPDCRFDWSHQYHRIVLRFQHTIAAQFFSHTHLDEFQVTLDRHGRPAAATFISPSVSPWQQVNPGYSVYYVDTASGEVIDIERWAVDLATANRHPQRPPHWTRLNTARHLYGLADLRPSSWLRVARRMASEPHFFSRVYSQYWGGSRHRPRCTDRRCRQRVLCNIVTTDRSTDTHCRHISRTLAAAAAAE